MEYTILCAAGDEYSAVDELVKLVNAHLAQGWRPLGGAGFAGGGDCMTQAYQTMVRD